MRRSRALAFRGLFHFIRERGMPIRSFLALWLALAWLTVTVAQDDPCGSDALARQRGALAAYLPFDFAGDPERSLTHLFRLGAAYQALALQCGYQPNVAEVAVMLERVLLLVPLDDLIAAQSVGSDVDAILGELAEISGDPIMGQMLYNGLEPALGGVSLGCAGCHENDSIAPLTLGTWTRADEVRIGLPQFAGYSTRRYLIESIVQPQLYVPPEYAGVMPDFYGSQLTAQQLADVVTFLESQDQLLED